MIQLLSKIRIYVGTLLIKLSSDMKIIKINNIYTHFCSDDCMAVCVIIATPATWLNTMAYILSTWGVCLCGTLS